MRHQQPQLFLAIRGTAAALTALAAAEFLGLACPYWAAMTALIVIQPTRGLLFEKSYYRLLGTAVGSTAGLLILLGTRSPLVITASLCFWIAGCVGIGNLLYGLRSYASMMAACTCAVIAMSGYQNPAHVYDIAFGRVACICVGIIFATLVTALFTPQQSRTELTARLKRLAADSVTWLAVLLRQGNGSDPARLEQQILIEIAEVENLLDAAGAGSFRFKKQARHIRSLIASLLSLLAVGRLAAEQLARHHDLDRRHGRWLDLLADRLDQLVEDLEGPGLRAHASEMAALAAKLRADLPLLGRTLVGLVSSLRPVLLELDTVGSLPEEEPMNRFLRHRDGQEACRAALRGALAIGAVGLTWALSGWAQGPLMMMATSIMISIFSTKEHPAQFVGQIFIGAAIGSAAAIFCRIVLLQGVSSALVTGLIVAPFLLIGVFAMTQRRTAIGATDATLFFIFTTQPGVPFAIVPIDLALGATAMLMGVGSAWLAYRYLVPINPELRLRSLLQAIMGDLRLLGQGASDEVTGKLGARMQHRVIRLVVLAARFDTGNLALIKGGVTALAIARGVQDLREVQETACDPSGAIEETLQSLAGLNPHSVTPTEDLNRAAHALYDMLGPGQPENAVFPPTVPDSPAAGARLWGKAKALQPA